jgi:beta-lactamase class A
MSRIVSRRDALRATALLPAGLARIARGDALEPDRALSDLETTSGGRLGVATLDTDSGAQRAHRADERFPMCSTFKLLAVAAVLARVDRRRERVDRRIPFGAADLLEYAPVTRERVGEGSMTVVDLCEAAITVSDNTAANLLLGIVGGPAGMTAYVRSIGDRVTRLDRKEPMLNEAAPGDVRDTTTPSAMLRNLKTLLLGTALSEASREKLIGWLIGNKTGDRRLRAGVPAGWRVGEKTGSGEHGTTNDVGIVWPPGREPILIAAYLTETSQEARASEAVLANVARVVAGMDRLDEVQTDELCGPDIWVGPTGR